MSRKIFLPSPINPYSIGGRAHDRLQFKLPLDEMWEVLCDQLYFVSYAFELKVHCFVMMKNHFHLLATSPKSNLSEAMRYFMRETSRTVNKRTGQINQFWGRRYFRSEITDYQYYMNAYKYFYLNPVTAKYCEKVEDYPYSTLHGIMGKSRILVPIHDDIFVEDPVGTLKWLNRPVNPDHLDSIRKGLRRQKFELPKVDSRPNPLNFELI